MNPMLQFFKQLSGNRNTSLFSVLNDTSREKLAYIRQLQREMKKQDILEIPFSKLPIVVFDLETTGFFPSKGDRILSIGAIKVCGEKLEETETFYTLIQTDTPPSDEIESLTGIKFEQLREAPPMETVLTDFFQFISCSTLVAHHAIHERNFMQQATWATLRTRFEYRIIDTTFLTRLIKPLKNATTLDECCEFFGIKIEKRHQALEDAIATAKLWQECVRVLQKQGFHNLKDVYGQLAKL